MSDATLHLYMQMLVSVFAVCLGLLVLMTMADADVSTVAARGLASLRLRRLRMNRMLAARNIDRRLYLELTPLAEIRREMNNCRHCPSRERCDADLSRCAPGSRYSYCPNTPFLDTLAARIRRQKQVARLA